MTQAEFARATPIYETFPGWDEDISKARTLDDLPRNARDYLTAHREDDQGADLGGRCRPGPRGDDRRAGPARLMRAGSVAVLARSMRCRRVLLVAGCTAGSHHPATPTRSDVCPLRGRSRTSAAVLDRTPAAASIRTGRPITATPLAPASRRRCPRPVRTATVVAAVPLDACRVRLAASSSAAWSSSRRRTTASTAVSLKGRVAVATQPGQAGTAARPAVRQHRPVRHHRHAGLRRGHQAGLRRRRARRAGAACAGRVQRGQRQGPLDEAARAQRHVAGRHAGTRRAHRRRGPGLGAVRRPVRRLRQVHAASWSECPLTGKGAALTFTVPTTREGGIWTPPGPSVSADGHLYVAVGNGASGPRRQL